MTNSSDLLHQLFESNVLKMPTHTAVKYQEERLTYKELNDKANRLAASLRSLGVKEGSIVAIFLDRSIEMIIAILESVPIKRNAMNVGLSRSLPIFSIFRLLMHAGAYFLNPSSCNTLTVSGIAKINPRFLRISLRWDRLYLL